MPADSEEITVPKYDKYYNVFINIIIPYFAFSKLMSFRHHVDILISNSQGYVVRTLQIMF
jgi:hypothetical protein